MAPYRSMWNSKHLAKNSDMMKSNLTFSITFDKCFSKYSSRSNEKQTLNLSRYVLVKIF